MEHLESGLVMRRASAADVDALCEFNATIFQDRTRAEPNQWVWTWTHDLMTRAHPTFKVDDFLIVQDTTSGRIVSSLNLISQTWSYGGIAIGVATPELVGTDPAYRRRGLVRRQFDVIHRWSAERGELVQAIAGIPWFYRQFGYEMALEHDTGRLLPRYAVPKLGNDATEPYTVRAATPDDVPFIAEVDRLSRDRYLVTAVRDEKLWRFELDGRSASFGPALAIVESTSGERVGFAAHSRMRWGPRLSVYAAELAPGTSWLSVTPSLLRYLAAQGAAARPRTGDDAFEEIAFWLGTQHPIYLAGGDSLRANDPYAFYMRVPDLPAFVRRIAPVLEKRLDGSIAAGHTGVLKLSFYRRGLELAFQNGRVERVEAFDPPQNLASGASFPDLTFLQLLFGWRSRAEVEAAFPDCHSSGDAAALVDVLFPRLPSRVWPIQ
jgi:hypothetical protein